MSDYVKLAIANFGMVSLISKAYALGGSTAGDLHNFEVGGLTQRELVLFPGFRSRNESEVSEPNNPIHGWDRQVDGLVVSGLDRIMEGRAVVQAAVEAQFDSFEILRWHPSHKTAAGGPNLPNIKINQPRIGDGNGYADFVHHLVNMGLHAKSRPVFPSSVPSVIEAERRAGHRDGKRDNLVPVPIQHSPSPAAVEKRSLAPGNWAENVALGSPA